MSIEKEFCTYNQALKLKALGFDEPCIMYIDDEGDLINDDTAEWIGAIKCPLKSQAFRWFREKYDYYISVFRTHDGNWGTDLWLLGVHKPKATVFGETYEEAELACLDKLIEIVEQKS